MSNGSTDAPVNANDAFDMAIQFEQRDDLPAAEAAYRAADQLGHAAAALSLGVLLEERDDLAGAEQAFRRADARGDATGAFHLAWMLQEGGDLTGAEEAYRRAELRGHPAAHANLRMMLGDRSNGGGAPVAAAPAPAEPPTPVQPAAAAQPAAPAPVEPPAHVDPPTLVHHPPPIHPEPPVASVTDDPPAMASSPATGAITGAAPAAAMASESPLVDPASADLIAAELSEHHAVPRPNHGRGAQSRSGGVLRKMLGIVVPVVAFGAAFLGGAATRTPAPAPEQIAPAANVARSSVTVGSMTPLPRPAKLIVKHQPAHKRAKPKTAATHTSSPAATPAQPVVQAPVSSAPPPPTGTTSTDKTTTVTNGSGGTSVSSRGTGTASGTG
jgi:hypothetical protein